MSGKPGTEREPKVDSTLSKGLLILEVLAQSKHGRGVSELSRELELTKSNVFRLLQTLTALGYVKHGKDKQYIATLKAWQVGRRVVDNLDLREMAAADMQMLARETQETIYLAVPEQLSVVYVDKIESQKPIRSWNPIGGNAPVYAVGTGKAIVAANYRALRSQLAGNLKRHTQRTITSLKALDDDVAVTQARGYAVDRGEFREQIFSYGAAICLPDGEALAAIGVSIPEMNLPDDADRAIGELVRAAAVNISAKLASS